MPKVPFDCIVCGRTVLRWPSRLPRAKYCSRACRAVAESGGEELRALERRIAKLRAALQRAARAALRSAASEGREIGTCPDCFTKALRLRLAHGVPVLFCTSCGTIKLVLDWNSWEYW